MLTFVRCSSSVINILTMALMFTSISYWIWFWRCWVGHYSNVGFIFCHHHTHHGTDVGDRSQMVRRQLSSSQTQCRDSMCPFLCKINQNFSIVLVNALLLLSSVSNHNFQSHIAGPLVSPTWKSPHTWRLLTFDTPNRATVRIFQQQYYIHEYYWWVSVHISHHDNL